MIHADADVSESAVVHESAAVWQLAQVREGAWIESGVVVGRGAYIGVNVRVGSNSKIQNFALIYEPATLAQGVFIGPAAVLTNDQYPRAIKPDGTQKSVSDWNPVGVTIKEGASVGARAVCVAPVTLGRWCMIAAGSVVTSNVPDFALMAGAPARRIGWVGEYGRQLAKDQGSENLWICVATSAVYKQVDSNTLVKVDSWTRNS